MEYQFIKVDNRDGVLLLTMHDPGTRNALGQGMAQEMLQELDRFEGDPEAKVLLVTGTEPSFCSGGDVRRFSKDIQERGTEDEQKPSLPWGPLRQPGEGGQSPGQPGPTENS